MTYNNVMNSETKCQWQKAMKEGMNFLFENKIWTLVHKPEKKKIINCSQVSESNLRMEVIFSTKQD